MKRAEISNIDGIEILENATSGFHFCDPPYPGHRSALYKEGIIDRHTTFDHERFVSAVRNANVKVMVTVSDHPLYRALADVCWIEALPVRYSAGTNGRPSPIVVTELLITNYRPEYQATVISAPTNPRAW